MSIGNVMAPVLGIGIGAGVGLALSSSMEGDGLEPAEAGGTGAATLVLGTVGWYAGKDIGKGNAGGVAGAIALGGGIAAACLAANLLGDN